MILYLILLIYSPQGSRLSVSVFYCLVLSNRDNFFYSLIGYSYILLKVYDIIQVCHVAIDLLCNTLYRNNGRSPDLKGKYIFARGEGPRVG